MSQRGTLQSLLESKAFQTLKKGWIWARTKNLLPILGVIFSTALMLWALWQLDLICVNPVWNTKNFIHWFGLTELEVFADEYFQCFIWKTTVGVAYDTFFSAIFLSHWILFFSLWFWRHGKK